MTTGPNRPRGLSYEPLTPLSCLRRTEASHADLAVVLPDAYMEIRDRAKDVIISGGENISSVGVEDLPTTAAGKVQKFKYRDRGNTKVEDSGVHDARGGERR